MTKYIFITTQFEGFHKYPTAPKKVSFLKTKHRHLFGVKIWIEVNHNNRDIEFLIFKNQVNILINNSNMNNSSCEMIANYLHNKIKLIYPNRKMKIEVNEDNENGCEIEYE